MSDRLFFKAGARGNYRPDDVEISVSGMGHKRFYMWAGKKGRGAYFTLSPSEMRRLRDLLNEALDD